MKEDNLQKEDNSQKILLSVGAAAIIVIVGFLFYLFRANDPAARGPIPYKKFDYGAHMQEQTRELNRQPGAAANTSSVPVQQPAQQVAPPPGPAPGASRGDRPSIR